MFMQRARVQARHSTVLQSLFLCSRDFRNLMVSPARKGLGVLDHGPSTLSPGPQASSGDPTELGSYDGELGSDKSVEVSEPVMQVSVSQGRATDQQPSVPAHARALMTEQPLAVQRALARQHLPMGYYISIDRVTGRRCLHCLRCYRTPAIDFDAYAFLGTSTPEATAHDRYCRSCFLAGLDEPVAVGDSAASGIVGADAVESDDSFTSDSSESSSCR